MIIYIDIVLLLDALVNFLLLSFIYRIFNEKICFWRVLVFSICGSMLILVAIYNHFLLKLVKIFGGLLTCCFAFNSPLKTRRVIEISLFYALNLALVGFLTSFKITSWYMLLVAIIAILIIFTLENFKKYYINIANKKYNVIIKFKNKLQTIEAFLDTGNNAMYEGIPVVFVNNKFRDGKTKEDIIIKIKTINGQSHLLGIKEKDFVVKINHKKIKRNVIISYCDMEPDCLIGPNLII